MRVLVTGVSEGIGGAICREVLRTAMAPADCGIAMCVRRGSEPVERLASEIRAEGAKVLIVEGDLRKSETPATLVNEAVAALGGLDAVVSNAGATSPAPLADLSIEDWETVFAVNCRATWLLAKAAFPHLKASAGAFVAISSQSGVFPHRDTGAYSSAKAALIMLCQQLALEWAEFGIRINAISPGMIRTPMTEKMYLQPEVERRRREVIPLHRIGEPRDIARAVGFLISPENRYITAMNMIVDGGFTASILNHVPGLVGKRT